MDYLFKELKNIEASEKTRNLFLKKVLKEAELLSTDRDELHKRLKNAEYACGKYREDLQSKQDEINSLQRQMDREPFVLVLIDGDISPFVDEYIQRGVSGGHDAARDLRNATKNYVEKLDGFQNHWKIRIWIYANITGLSSTYANAGITNSLNLLRQFVQGFNNENRFGDFVDAGADKEVGDNKVKGTLEMLYYNLHCKHIVLGVSGDNSYVNFLREFVPAEDDCGRLTLLETIPFPRSFEDLVPKFKRTQFEKLFRSSKIIARQVPIRGDKAVSPVISQSPPSTYASTASQKSSATGIKSATEVDQGGAAGESGTVKKRSPSNSHSSTSLVEPSSVTASPQQQHQPNPKGVKILRNRAGHRIDPAVQHHKELFKRLKNLKLCNRHYLTHCVYTDCTHDHNYKGRMGPTKLNTLRYIARMSCCVNSIWCQDPNCVAGHRCIQDPKCTWGSNCRFSGEMHNVDTKIVEAIVV